MNNSKFASFLASHVTRHHSLAAFLNPIARTVFATQVLF